MIIVSATSSRLLNTALAAYRLPTGHVDTVLLAPGTQTYLEIQWLASWEQGYPEAGWGFAPNSFGILTMSPQLAQAHLPILTYNPQLHPACGKPLPSSRSAGAEERCAVLQPADSRGLSSSWSSALLSFTSFDPGLLEDAAIRPISFVVFVNRIVPAMVTASNDRVGMLAPIDPVISSRTGSPAAGPHVRTGNFGPVSRKSTSMPREAHVLMSTSVGTVVRARRRPERLSPGAAVSLIGLLSLAIWTGIIAFAVALI